MTTINAGMSHTLLIEPGKVVRITAGAGVIGAAWWYGNGSYQDQFASRIWSEQVITLGPYVERTKLRVECYAGSIDVADYGASAPHPVSVAELVSPMLADKLSALEMVSEADLLSFLIDSPEGAAETAVNAIINALTRTEPEPSVDTLAPADDASSVALDTTELSITFDSPIKFGAEPTITLFETSTGTIVQRWNLDDVPFERMIIDFDNMANDWLRLVLNEPLAAETDYHVLVSPGSVVSEKYSVPNSGIVNDNSWNFTTVAAE